MDAAKGLAGLVGTVVIAGWVAFAVSSPRNVDNMMDQEMASLDGKSINQSMAEAKSEARAVQCEQYSDAASRAWDRAVEDGTTDRDAAKIEELDRQVERFCS